MGRGACDFDDNASYPRAGLHLFPYGTDEVRRMLDNVDAREEILRKVGEYHFGVYDASVRKRVKTLFNALENDGTYANWRERHGIKPGTAPHQGCAFNLTGGGTFNLQRYIAAIDGNTEWLAERLPHMHSFIAKWFRQQGEHGKRPERTLKSYVLQETEAISREQKLRWARTTDRAAVNLQHDGVLLQLRPYDDKPYVETALTSLCSAALGYPQPVSHKPWPGSDQKA